MNTIDASIPLQAKQFQVPDVASAMNNAMNYKAAQQSMQMNEFKLNEMQQEATDTQKMNQSLQGLDPNDPHYDDIAVQKMREAGVSDSKILSFKASHLKVESAMTEKKLKEQELKDKEIESVNKMNDRQKARVKEVSSMIADTTGDVVRSYDSAIKAMGNRPTPQGENTARATAETLFRAHIKQLLDNPDLDPEMKKQIQAQAQKPFDINQIRELWTTSQRHLDLVSGQSGEAKLAEERTKAGHAETLATLDEQHKRAQIDQERASTLAAGKKILPVIDPDTGKQSYDIIDMKTGNVTRTDTQAVPKTNAATSATTQRFNTTVLTNAHQMAADMTNLVDLKDPSGAGWAPKHNETLAQAAKRWAANKETNSEAIVTDRLLTGIGKNIITVEQGGRITSQKLTDEMQSRYRLQAGMSLFDKKYALAMMRQDLEKAVESQLSSGTFNEEQRKLLNEDLEVMKQAVPYTPQQLSEARRGKNPSFKQANPGSDTVDATNPLLR
jgi:hypothetical protein